MATQNFTIERKNNRHMLAGFIGTSLIHGVILAFLLMFFIYPPNPPLDSIGMMMSLGEENMGGPSLTPVPDPSPNETYTPISEATEDELKDLTQDNDESVAIKEQKEKEKKDKKEKKNPEKPKDIKSKPEKTPQLELPKKVDQQALFRKSKNKAGGNGGYGDGDIPGNEGRPDGDPRGNPDGEGSGLYGNGKGGDGPLKFDLEGRSMKKLPNVEDNSTSVGKVVVRIVVDRDGNVIKAVPGQPGSTTIESSLLEKARQGALQTKFSSKSDGPDEQFGYITFVFRFKN
jgi:outer membrane biosynthesis protein TonB